ncbi:phage resistance protein [Streptomyces sp. NBC_00963]|uniref:phage resistance protein n=1 Tax=Streptomyces sp. NBC_00963 TaxID=2903697 RepID=UPI0038684ABC|nr:phage resistance protein [Streptomyces sp. NBC_00963]
MTHPTQPLLREVIEIPENITGDDYVLKLTEALGSDKALSQALDTYVLTPRLVDRYGDALSLVQSALDSGSSKAAYLHGSFGSGKSHFMAVLAALLGIQERAALRVRGYEDFAGLMREHTWVQGAKPLLLPVYMLGGKSLEQKIFGGYVDYMRRVHPKAPIPQIYRTDALFENIQGHRKQMGDEAFIAGLPGGATDKWGDSSSFWTSKKLDAALVAEQVDEEQLNTIDPHWHQEPTTPGGLRAKLVSDALGSWFKGLFAETAENRSGFVSLDRGLGIVAAHAKALGYDTLVLFLDELILWLANHIQNEELVSEEAAKITNFVEGSDTRRAIPLVTFIARQRDLRELVGEDSVQGSAEVSIQDTLSLANDRFRLIQLPDSDLPTIAHKRMLQPRRDVPDAVARVDQAFANIKRVKREVWDALLGTSTDITAADEKAFRDAFPFSPAFMDTLVRVAEALSRSRTGLKLMQQMLYDRRNSLRLGDLVPLGDLYEVLHRGGTQPFTRSLTDKFRIATELYKNKLRPHLLEQHELSDGQLETHRKTPEALEEPVRLRAEAFVTDDRFIGTLLLSALVPSVPAFQNLTVKRLTALNHGIVTSRVSGMEAKEVGRKIKEWSETFPEIEYVPGPDAGVGLKLVGVDYESVIRRAEPNNNPNNRRALIKRLLRSEITITEGQLEDRLNLVWRGSSRSLEVLFGNLADANTLPEEKLFPSQEGHWRLVIDMPFDDVYGEVEDRTRVRQMQDRPDRNEIRTVCWIPAHFTRDMYAKFQKLVTIDYVLNGQRFDSYAGHLNPDDRERAKAALQNQHRSLTSTVRTALKQAYGLAPKDASVVNAHDEHVMAVPDVAPILPQYNQSMYDAARLIADRVLAHQYPAHPDFDPPRSDGQKEGLSVKAADVRTVFAYLRSAADQNTDVVDILPKHRELMARIAGQKGLKLGTMHEARFQVGRHWEEHFGQKAGTAYDGKDISVRQLLSWIDEPVPYGLDPLLAHLVLCAYAEHTDRVWAQHGGPVALADPTALRATYQLMPQRLPSQADWELALERGGLILGVTPLTPLRRARIIADFSDKVRGRAKGYLRHSETLVEVLQQHADQLGLDTAADDGRLATARRGVDLLAAIEHADRHDPLSVVAVLAEAEVDGRAVQERVGHSVVNAESVAGAVVRGPWTVVKLAATLREPYATEAATVLGTLHGVAQADELTARLPDALDKAESELTRIIGRANTAVPPPSPAPTPRPQEESGQGHTEPESGEPESEDETAAHGRYEATVAEAAEMLEAELAALAGQAPDARVQVSWRRVDPA